MIDCCSGLPVEWDINNSGGLGVLPGQTGIFSFTADPTTIAISSGYWHSWESDIQVDIINYPTGDEPEVPDVFTIDIELCCYDDANNNRVCEPVLEGECAALGGTVVDDCTGCFSTPTDERSWGSIKNDYR